MNGPEDSGPRPGVNPAEPAALRRLERAERLLGCFQKAVNHELPNQIVALRGLMQMLLLEEQERLGPEGRDYLARLGAVAQRLQTLVAGLAELGRSYHDASPAEPVPLHDVAREAAAEVKKLSPAQEIEYHFQEPGPVLRVPCLALRQVLVQLLRNAVRAAVPGRALRIDVGGGPSGPGVEFWVRDNGRGIAAETQRRLFEPFPGGDGTGLGLFLVRQIVDGWGGSVRAQSEPGGGSVFIITLSSQGAASV
jgi:signal transduction histidine kinase